jgi:uncharacterized protein YyaL (SSP411 family)
MKKQHPANHLEGETSPYLLQHLYNPVDWRPWGEQAMERARRLDRPLFISIGYAACHWCHVMERESFEDENVARILNEGFVPIKIDREERPEIDEIYMSAVQAMTGQGGWPLSVFCTPDGRPFFGGTYYPPEPRHGMPSFAELLGRIRQIWDQRRDELERSATDLTARLVEFAAPPPAIAEGVGAQDQDRAFHDWQGRFDPRHGGFGGAPKFPPDGALTLLLDRARASGDETAVTMARTTLDGMAKGGLFDPLAGGFARYAVDEFWLVPHFEKMLYNQALMTRNYLRAWQLWQDPLHRVAAAHTLKFVQRELTDAAGGFHASLDADSEGEEGRFYVWSEDQIDRVLGDRSLAWKKQYGITAEGNFEGANIPNLIGRSYVDFEQDNERLLHARAARIRPATDDKIVTAWNGLMISAFAEGWQTLGDRTLLESARSAASFLLTTVQESPGRMYAGWRAGRARHRGTLDDHAFFARSLIDLYESDSDKSWLDAAGKITETMLEHFADRDHGGFFCVADDHETLLVRNRSSQDGALPSGAGVAIETMARLAIHLDRPEWHSEARRHLDSYADSVRRFPTAFPSMLIADKLL